MSGEQKVGLAYKRLDLHIHTYASTCFDGTCTPEDIVDTAIDKGLDGIAITDHNSVAAVDDVIKAAEGKPLVVFPGVELTCTGGKKSIHVLALFDTDKRAKDLQVLLNVMEITSGYGQEETLTDKSAIEVIREIHRLDGIAVLAHANSGHGVLSGMRGQARTRVIQHPQLLAAEATDFLDQDKTNRQKRVVDLLDGNDPTYQRRLAVYQASDNLRPDGSGKHCLEAIGSRFSYFKLETINLEGLRQCFVDSPVRIRQDFDYRPFVYPRIKDIRVTSGFLDGQGLQFHPGLTSILGAKGAGKSLLIEFMRFVLNQEPRHPTIAEDHAAKLRERLGEYGVVDVTVVDEAGKEFQISRTYRDLDRSPYDDSVPYDPAKVFPVLFLSQGEIIKVAEDEGAQLEFIDQFFDFQAYRSNIASIENQLEQLDKQMADGLRAYSEFDELSKKVATLEVEMARLDEALKHPIFEEFRRLELKEKALSDQGSHLRAMIGGVEEAGAHIRAIVAPEIPDLLARDPALLRNRDLLLTAREVFEEQFSLLVSELHKQIQRHEDEYSKWRPIYAEGKGKYDNYIKQMGSDYQGLAHSRQRVRAQMNSLEKARDAAKKKRDELPAINKQREHLLDSLQHEYEQYTRERQERCTKLQNDAHGRLRLRILGSSNVEEFRSRLLDLKRGSYLREDEIDAICSRIRPRDFVLSLLRYHATRQTSHLEERAKEAGIDLERMRTLADFLLGAIPYEDSLALQYKAHPQDRPEILYDIGDGDYQPLAKVSVGQKCTAMLIIALSEGVSPIVIDQPEDSLDIRSIWEDMCLKLREGKETRQFIFTTHNSSLAVASDTDCYAILEGSASQGKVVHVGAMDHLPMSSEVLQYLEGGPSTYDLKFAKYNRERDQGD